MQPRPIQQDQDKESFLGRLASRCLPKSALGAGKLACLVSAFAMLIGLALLITSQVQNRQQQAAASAASSHFDPAMDDSVIESLNQEWVRLRNELVSADTLVLPHSPQARALMWLAICNHEEATLSANVASRSPLALPERYALAVLYYHWSGSTWDLPEVGGWDVTWNPKDMGALHSKDECEWFGVTCAPSSATTDMTVTQLNMTGGTNFFLRGSMPTELGHLSNMIAFSAAYNQLRGSLPNELQSWTDLKQINLRFNQLTGLGESYKSWSELAALDIGDNRFAGNMSSHSLRRMNKLKTLSITNNRLLNTDGPLFTEAINGPYWPDLDEIAISVSQVELDLTHFSDKSLPRLKVLDAGQVPLIGSIPAAISTLTDLQFFNLASPVMGQLTGSIPTEIGLLSDSLSFVSLDATGISGALPTEIGLLKNVKTFSAYINSITGTIPTEVGDMTSLEYFSVAQSEVSGTIPTEFGNCSKLNKLQLYSTELRGTMPAEICERVQQIKDVMFEIGASCAITTATANAQQIICDCCSACYGA